MPKKGTSQGSVYYDKRKDRWVAQYYEFDNEKEKTIRRTKFLKTKEEAKQKLGSIMYQKNNPIYIQNNGIPIIELMKAIAKKKLERNLISKGQFGRIKQTINLISKSNIANIKIDELKSEEIQNYLNSVKDYSNSYIKKIFEQFTQSFNYAMDKGYIYRNPMCEVIKPKSLKKDKTIYALKIDEQQNFTKYLKKVDLKKLQYRNAFLIQMYMGLRIGECLALRNNDIDLDNNFIRVDKTLTTDENGKVIMGDTTKSYSGERDLPIPKHIKKYIMEQMKIGEGNRDNQLFLTKNGTYVNGKDVNRILKRIAKKDCNIMNVTTHRLRHTFGTRCIEAGMSPVVVQKLLGHKDVGVTLNTYTSVFNKYENKELEKLNRLYMQSGLVSKEKGKEKEIER